MGKYRAAIVGCSRIGGFIDNEIITYTGKTATSFTGCVRGFSGIENNNKTNQPEFLTFTQTGVSTHPERGHVTNLSNVFLQNFYKKLKSQVLPGFTERNLHGKVSKSNFVRQAKDFYRTKGTEEGFKLLFGALYGEKVEMIQPANFMIRPSDADYVVNDILIGKQVSGDATKLLAEIEADTLTADSSVSRSFEEFAAENPLYALLYPNVNQQSGQLNTGPVVGFCAIKDTAALNAYLNDDAIKNRRKI